MRSSLLSNALCRVGLLVAIPALLLGGCAGKVGMQGTQVHFYPRCHAPLAELRRADAVHTRTVAGGGLLGALFGALTGYLITGKAEGALWGAAAGGAAGTAAGWLEAEAERDADANRRLSSYLGRIEGDISGLNHVTASARLAVQCYDERFRDALAAYKAGRIGRGELQARYAEIRSGTQEAARLMGRTADRTRERERLYAQALLEEARAAGRTETARAADAAPPKSRVGARPRSEGAGQARRTAAVRTAHPAAPARTASEDRGPAEEPVRASLDRMEEKTGTLREGRRELEREADAVASLQRAWAADLAAIGS